MNDDILKARHLKNILNIISDASLTYRDLNSRLPLSKAINENKIKELIREYERIIEPIKIYIINEYGKSNSSS
jgi:hypothetical protein